jgi:cytochrome b subunit of formate dehydrogenase
MNTSKNKSFKSRKVISIVLFAALIILPITGILIDVAERTKNEFLLHFSTIFHALTGIVFTIFGIFHVVKNWRVMKTYICKSSKNHAGKRP